MEKLTEADLLVLKQIRLICRNAIKFHNMVPDPYVTPMSPAFHKILVLIYETHPIKELSILHNDEA